MDSSWIEVFVASIQGQVKGMTRVPVRPGHSFSSPTDQQTGTKRWLESKPPPNRTSRSQHMHT